MRVALAHDYLNQYGGAERVLERLHEMYPSAPIYTSMYDPELMPPAYRTLDLRTSFMQRLPLVTRRHQMYLLFYPLAFESFRLAGYDLVISNSSAFCKAVITPPETLHICYCLTPMRWAWSYHDYLAREQINGPVRLLLPPIMAFLRLWDATTSARVDHFIAISTSVARRIRKYYRREATIIHPPVNTSLFRPAERVEDYYLVVSRLIPYKRIDLAVAAFNKLGLPLKIIGDGRDRAALQSRARGNIDFLGHLSDEAVREYIARCQAVIFPGEEDFGIVPVEAQAAGRPVIAYGEGGARDTVVDGVTGLLFRTQTVEALVEAVKRSQELSFDTTAIVDNARIFDASNFQRKLGEFVASAMADHRETLGARRDE